MIALRREVKAAEDARAGAPYRCPRGCGFEHADVEVVWNHMWTHPEMNRRTADRRVAGDRRGAA